MVAIQLKEIFDVYVELDIAVWKNFEKLGVVEEFPREHVLKEPFTTEKYINIVLEGSGGSLIWKNNNFVCIDIVSKNEFLCDYMSFTLQQKTPIEVRLFEDSRIFRIPHQNFQKTFESGNYGNPITKIIAENSFILKQQQQIDLLTKTAKERYVEMIENNQSISQIPLKFVASYLGITPQSLSRIRAEKIRELPNGK
jgi:CRP-like cAMP-binding protein